MAIRHHHAGMPGKVRLAFEKFTVKTGNFTAECGNAEVERADTNADEIQGLIHWANSLVTK
ncbi:hypothetical protein D3C71_1669650 [compost metagenome]